VYEFLIYFQLNAQMYFQLETIIMKWHLQGSYDSMSSYDSYNNTNGNANYGANLSTSTGRLGPNVPDDLKSSSMPARAHDPYRSTFSRSTAQPVAMHDAQTRTDYAKYRYAVSARDVWHINIIIWKGKEYKYYEWLQMSHVRINESLYNLKSESRKTFMSIVICLCKYFALIFL